MKITKLTIVCLALAAAFSLAGAAPPAALAMGCGQMDHSSDMGMGSGQMSGHGAMGSGGMAQAPPGQFPAPASGGGFVTSPGGPGFSGGNPTGPTAPTPADSGHTHQN